MRRENSVSSKNRRRNFREPTVAGISSENRMEIVKSLTLKKALHSDSSVDKWIFNKVSTPRLSTRTISLSETKGWQLSPETGDICHESGKFFSITGAYIRHRSDFSEFEWDQPIIDQPEVGILGIAAKKINGVLHFCLQAKEEPGNLNHIQLSPTVQATYSNYTRVHGGSPPEFIEYFLEQNRSKVMYARLQSEDGGRFLFKSNRNMVVIVPSDELNDLPENFIWVTLRQIKQLLQRDNLVNACTRSIISALILPDRPERVESTQGRINNNDSGSLLGILQWIDNRRAVNHFLVKRRPLKSLTEWSMDRDGSFSHEEGRFFRVIGLDVKSSTREVSIWNQPILDTPGTGVIGILTRKVRDELQILMQTKAEPGNRNIVLLAPTVQFMQQNYSGNRKLQKPFLFDEFASPGRFELVHESVQSEEGARFYQEAHIHRILALPKDDELELPPDFRWISKSDLHTLVNMGDTVNSCARSVISLLHIMQVT